MKKGSKYKLSSIKKISRNKTGVPQTEKHKKKISIANLGKPKKEKIKYSGIHMWVRNLLGRPRLCEHCGDKTLRHRQYHWANISRLYKRNIQDWKRLCAKCHKLYDKKQ